MRLKLETPVAIDFAEALRYCGGGSGIDIENTLPDIKSAASELLAAARPAACAMRFELKRSENALLCGDIPLEGEAIKKHLQGCHSAVLLALTLGFEADRLIASSSAISPYKALLFDGCASAATESLADLAEEAAKKELLAENESFVPRFSPGYGDLPLTLQAPILQAINAGRLIGLCVGASLMLSPIKSVTAIIGVKNSAANEEKHGGSGCKNKCSACAFTSCPYRKGE